MEVDGKKFMEAECGGVRSAAALLQSYGAGPSEANIQKWSSRGVPPGWVLTLLAVLEMERGAPVSVAPYLA